MPDCPAPDCDYSAPSKEALRGHWGGSQDEQHAGAWHQAWQAYEEARGATTEQAPEQSHEQARGEAPGARASQAPSEAPDSPSQPSVEPQRLELPTRETDASDAAADATGGLCCPECGGDRGERVSSLTSRLREADTKQARRVLKRYDWTAVPGDAWVCGPCWEDGEVTIYADEA